MKQVVTLLAFGVVFCGFAMDKSSSEDMSTSSTQASLSPVQASSVTDVQPDQSAVRRKVIKNILFVAPREVKDPMEFRRMMETLEQCIQNHRTAGDIDSPAAKKEIFELESRLLKATAKVTIVDEEEQN